MNSTLGGGDSCAGAGERRASALRREAMAVDLRREAGRIGFII